MHVYILNQDFQKEDVIDDYRSFVWTERFNETGDFNLVLNPNQSYRVLFKEDRLLMIDESKRLMVVEDVEDSVDDQGEPSLVVTGRSYEAVMDSKVARLSNQLAIRSELKRGDFSSNDPSNFDEAFKDATSAMYEITHNYTTPPMDNHLLYMTIHGGAGARGTTELKNNSLPLTTPARYELRFKTVAGSANRMLSPEGFDEPLAVEMAESHQAAIGWLVAEDSREIVIIGGTNLPLKRMLQEELTSNGIEVEMATAGNYPEHEYHQKQAIFNRTARGGAVLTVSQALMEAMITDLSSASSRANSANWTQKFHDFTSATKLAVNRYFAEHVLTLAPPKIEVDGYPHEIVEELVEDSIVKSSYSNYPTTVGFSTMSNPDRLSQIDMEDIYDPGDIPWPEISLKTDISTRSLLKIVEEITQDHHLGFRMVRCPHCYKVKFSVYSGSDRYESIRFSSEYENFTGARSYISFRDYRNVAYVSSNLGTIEVFIPGTEENLKPNERRVLHVDAGNYSYDDLDYRDDMYARGWNALLEHNQVNLVDGEVPQTVDYTYDVDYHLGDIVGVTAPDGTIGKMRVTEYIFISDAEGVRSYPTLSQEERVSLGTWLSAEWDIEWVDAEGTWSEA